MSALFSRSISVLLIALLLTIAACSPAQDASTAVPADDAEVSAPSAELPDDETADEAVISTGSIDAGNLPAATLTELDPASLEPNSFTIEVVHTEGIELLEPHSRDAGDDYFIEGKFVDNRPVGFNSRTLMFSLVEQTEERLSTSDVKLQLPGDLQPGTYPITDNALLMTAEEDVRTYGAYVASFTQEWHLFDRYQGELTITEVTDDTISGSFHFLAADGTGAVHRVTAVFNSVG